MLQGKLAGPGNNSRNQFARGEPGNFQWPSLPGASFWHLSLVQNVLLKIIVKFCVNVTFLSFRSDNLLRLMSSQNDMTSGNDLVKNSSLYREFQAEREEILKHKWIESEKAGYDIGFEHALTDWIIKHRSKWRRSRQHPHSSNNQ